MQTIIFFILISSLALTAWAQPLDLELDINRGFNNNVFLESDEILSNANSSNTQTEDVQTQTGIFLAYEFLDAKNSDASLVVDYFQERFDSNDLETSIQSYSLPISVYLADYRIKTTWAHTRYQLSGNDVLAYRNAQLDIAKRLGDNRLGLLLSVTAKTPQDEAYNGYDGTSRDAGLYYLWRGDFCSMRWALHGFDNDYSDEYLASRGYAVKASFTHRHSGHHGTLSGRFKHSTYNPDPLYDQSRNDGQYYLSYSHYLYLFSHLNVYLRSEYTVNRSNIAEQDDNFNYSQWISSVGLTVSL